jgi:hypothetical protein
MMPYAANETNPMLVRPIAIPPARIGMSAGIKSHSLRPVASLAINKRPRRKDDRCNKQTKPMKIFAYLRIPPAREEHVPVVVIVAHGHGLFL